jgi:hypothetical protein
MARTFKTITAGELRELLEDLDDDAPVAFASNYGDRGGTRQVHALAGDAEELPIEESRYSESGWALWKDAVEPRYAEPKDLEPPATTVTIIS